MRYKNALDREIYNNRHNVYTSKKEELKRALLEERNRLLNIQSEELGANSGSVQMSIINI